MGSTDEIGDVNRMERLIKILNWCKEHPLERGYEYEVNAFVCHSFFGLDMGIPVSQDEIACCYKILGYKVEKKRTIYGPGWRISVL